MSRIRTEEERRRRVKAKKKRGGSPYKTVIKPINLSELIPETEEFVRTKMKRGWITENTRCPCNSGHRFKKCCMKRRINEREEVHSSPRLDQVTH